MSLGIRAIVIQLPAMGGAVSVILKLEVAAAEA